MNDPQPPRRKPRRGEREPADAAEVRRHQQQDDESADAERTRDVRPQDPAPDRVIFDENESAK